MNAREMQAIVGEVISRLQRRAQSTATLSAHRLREEDEQALFRQHAALHITQADLPFLRQLAAADATNLAARKTHDALAAGISERISLHRGLFDALPVKKLARLPISFADEQGRPLFLHPGPLLSYADIARLGDGQLLLARKCLVTALAREAAGARNIQLIKQE